MLVTILQTEYKALQVTLAALKQEMGFLADERRAYEEELGDLASNIMQTIKDSMKELNEDNTQQCSEIRGTLEMLLKKLDDDRKKLESADKELEQKLLEISEKLKITDGLGDLHFKRIQNLEAKIPDFKHSAEAAIKAADEAKSKAENVSSRLDDLNTRVTAIDAKIGPPLLPSPTGQINTVTGKLQKTMQTMSTIYSTLNGVYNNGALVTSGLVQQVTNLQTQVQQVNPATLASRDTEAAGKVNGLITIVQQLDLKLSTFSQQVADAYNSLRQDVGRMINSVGQREPAALASAASIVSTNNMVSMGMSSPTTTTLFVSADAPAVNPTSATGLGSGSAFYQPPPPVMANGSASAALAPTMPLTHAPLI